MTMRETLLEARDLRKTYPSGTRTLVVLESSSLDLRSGERLAIIGPSGVGKSTLLHLLGGLDRPDEGTLRFRGRDLRELDEAELASFRNRHVGMVFQFYHLLHEFTAVENVMMPLLIGGRREGAESRARQLLEETGLGDRSHHYPSELSGGERQRVAIARALASAPELLLADEPTGNLDHDNGLQIMSIFDELHQIHETAMVMVTHNPALVGGFDRVLEMGPGGILAPGRVGPSVNGGE
jgi:lipoprotein-releasing system ATP-binding protein